MASILDNIISHLQQGEKLNHKVKLLNMSAYLSQLQKWQTKRLLSTYDDLWQSKRFHPAMAFFIEELYGPKDFTQRDQEIARVVPKMAKLLPNQAMESLEAALRLNSLSYELDIAMADKLEGAEINQQSYALAYRECENRALREEQISLLEGLGQDLAEVVKIRGITALLMMSRKPAKLAGVESLHSFLETGFKAFKKLGNVDDFIVPIVTRERLLMETLFDHPEQNILPDVHL